MFYNIPFFFFFNLYPSLRKSILCYYSILYKHEKGEANCHSRLRLYFLWYELNLD